MIDFDKFNFSGHKVVMRVDFNVPLNASFDITDATRINGALPTIFKILEDGGSVVLMSHLGRPKGGPENKYSLQHIVFHLQNALSPFKVKFVNDCISTDAFSMSESLKGGEVLLLENLRFYPEEEAGDEKFAKKLSKHGDIYINDAFGTAHRAHASTASIAKFFDINHKGFGYLMAAEVNNANKVLKHAEKPVTAIVGGAKVSDKIKLLENLIDSTDNILIGGGMAYTFIAAQGGKIGKSLFEPDYVTLALKIIQKARENNTEIYLPEDTVVADKFGPDANTDIVNSNEIPDGWMGLDIGPIASEKYKSVILSYSIMIIFLVAEKSPLSSL
jgi:phosphoglycerate kinase